MQVFEIVIGLLLGGALLAVLSRRIGAPYPAMMALAGAGLALIPGVPAVVLDPQLALTLFVAPVLLDAAYDSSQRDLKANWRAITGLAVGAVALTVVVVAVTARLLVPALPWPVAIALGAIVAPPDAAAASAVLRQLRPPQRVLVILEGESLFNDAGALLIYRLAVRATLAGALSPAHVIPLLLFATLGSLALGFALSHVLIPLIARSHDPVVVVVLQFCGTFAVWSLAERLHLSGILTTVVFAMATARRSAEITPARVRVPTYAVWDFAVFVLNVLAFILIGFQLKGILGRIGTHTLAVYVGFGAAVCIASILARIAWVWTAAAYSRWRCRSRPWKSAHPPDRIGLSKRGAAVVGWCGMRGIVTLAAALALPTAGAGGPGFPFRDLIVFSAFSVVLGTLVIQGMTVSPLMKLLRIQGDPSLEREVRFARVEILRAALSAVSDAREEEVSDLLRRRYEFRLRRAHSELTGDADVPDEAIASRAQAQSESAAVIRTTLSVERQRLLALRANGTIGDRAFQELEQELDFEELYLHQVAPEADPMADRSALR
jgi:CPA1 family monovalent cation:H+ antiporter